MTGKTNKTPEGKEQAGKSGFHPFADDATSRTIAGFSVENGTERIALHGALDITRDRAGLAQARVLRDTLEAIVQALEGADLPEQVADAEEAEPRTVANPFA
jgi:hypothetical protein